MKNISQRIAVFIDTSNLYHSAKRIYQSKVNFDHLLKTVVDGRQLTRALAYVVRTETGEEKAFIDELIRIGIEPRIKDLIVFSDGEKKADWDVGITIDAVRIAPRVDCVVLITGDGDFVPLVEHLQAQGVFVEVVGFGQSCAQKLRESADTFFDISEHPNEFLIHSRQNRRPFLKRTAVKKAISGGK